MSEMKKVSTSDAKSLIIMLLSQDEPDVISTGFDFKQTHPTIL
ncbi:MAG TPA: hypothetical protein VEL70_02540 [Candidatus Acidoferrum sp.]|nr:hypothetical protein [Candidatus Acidoferrum sp.]